MNSYDYDLVVVGGGINGAGIAATAAIRGLKVFLCEQRDLASATSSASSKLIHGGLRYLENYEFQLVRESLLERERLLKIAKHLVRPQPFILPYERHMRSRSLLRLGLFLYDHLARHSLPKTRSIHFNKDISGKALKKTFQYGFEYYDCKTDDARLVVANAQKAKQLGATIATYTQCTGVKQHKNYWEIFLHDHETNNDYTVTTKALVNATGPWVDRFLNKKIDRQGQYSLALIKGSHIVVPKFYQGDFAFTLQNNDGRVIFVIPYLTDFLLVGTTDIFYHEKEIQPAITNAEIVYLKSALSNYFNTSISLPVVHSFSGVRPLLNDKNKNPSMITRGYSIEMINHEAPAISIFGGKLTTFRSLAVKAVSMLEKYFPHLKDYDERNHILPGSDYEDDAKLKIELQQSYPWLPSTLVDRYLHAYGTQTKKMLGQIASLRALGTDFGGSLYQREVDYLYEEEWARCAEDILWRRSKLGYFFPKENISALSEYLNNRKNTDKNDTN